MSYAAAWWTVMAIVIIICMIVVAAACYGSSCHCPKCEEDPDGQGR